MMPDEALVGNFLGIALTSGLMIYLIKTIREQNNYSAKKRITVNKDEKEKTFEDVGGCEQAKEAIKEIIDYITHPESFRKMGVRMPKGILLSGPPGTGKTLIAKVAASEAGIPVLYASGSEFVELYVGMGAKRIRDLFKQARSFSTPCMIFIDEIDAVGFKRSAGGQRGFGNREAETTLNQLLNEMDGFESSDNVLVVAATNLISNLDPALLRPGRFDRKIEVKLPDALARKKILQIHLRSKNHTCSEKALGKAATQLDGCSGADIENLVNLVALQAVRKSRLNKHMEDPVIGDEELDHAVGVYNSERRQSSAAA
mmetsp:Transcript_40622/g.61897  ORF Transcript_40622/g.61897 Transcript_40622/m.61897 type:complete len:315 (+) Transcript_40622:439-1383(+)